MRLHTLYMPIKFAVISTLCGLLIACGGGGGSNSANEGAQSDIQTSSIDKNQSRKNIYSQILADQRFPADFYQEPENNSNLFYTIRHISNHDIALYDVAFSYPLCEDSFSAALQKSETEALNTNTTLVDNSDNNWYYEFSRSNNSNASTMYIQRLYKCETYTVNSSNNYKGLYNPASINTNDYLKFIQYQWYFSFNNNYGNIILSSTVNTDTAGITQAIIVNAKINSTGECNEIVITENYYDLDNTTREITHYEIIVDTFQAKKVNSIIEVCL